jgi:excisionase family DNA binding protein
MTLGRLGRLPLSDTHSETPDEPHTARSAGTPTAHGLTIGEREFSGLDPRLATEQRTARGAAMRNSTRTTLTVAELCAELDISRSTFYEWRSKKRGPRCIKLPNGEIRIRRSELERWLESREEAA